jgi:hypothetical protein
MNLLRELFETDFAGLPYCGLTRGENGASVPRDAEVRVHYDFVSNSKFLSCFLSSNHVTDAACEEILTSQSAILSIADAALGWVHGMPGDTASLAPDLRFGGRLFVYHDVLFPSRSDDRLNQLAQLHGTSLKLRGPDYLKARLAVERPRGFILHDARDTNHIARPIAQGLAQRRYPTWFHNFAWDATTKPNELFAIGTKQATTCILIVSPYLLKSRTWNPLEFHRVMSPRLRQPRLLHAIWYHVTAKQVGEFSPLLAEHPALRWELGPKQEESINELHRALRT